jgi:hypothetical protein|tara:strand:- start:56 stop:289 length:234 start_codon:yes stop_codon:yes gene_type:complete
MSNLKKYKLNELLITKIWKDLHASGNEKLASEMAKEMINQGCESIPLDDVYLVLMFWKDYLEENEIISFSFEDKIIH